MWIRPMETIVVLEHRRTLVRTFDGAAMKMQTSAEGGTVDTNRIVIIGTASDGNGETELLRQDRFQSRYRRYAD